MEDALRVARPMDGSDRLRVDGDAGEDGGLGATVEASDHSDQSPLCVRAALYIALGGLQRGVAGKLLDELS